MDVVIIGCGLIGKKRALSLTSTDKLVGCCDTNSDIAKSFGKEFVCDYFNDYKELLVNCQCDTVIVSVVNKYAKNIIMYALRNGKNVIAEKPLGRNFEESSEIYEEAKKNKMILKVGFNHRFHPGIWEAKRLVDSGEIGDLFSIRARYGHGGRAGMEKEWRASKDLCGGGELLDQGVHVIDLIRWFGGEVNFVTGIVETKFWDMEVEDNAFVILKTNKNVSAVFHVSWTNWRNIFSLEIFGNKGYIKVEGLGGSYGTENLEIGRRKPEGGIPDISNIKYEQNDVSWSNEWLEFKNAVKENREPLGSGYDGLKANKVIETIYESNYSGKAIEID